MQTCSRGAGRRDAAPDRRRSGLPNPARRLPGAEFGGRICGRIPGRRRRQCGLRPLGHCTCRRLDGLRGQGRVCQPLRRRGLPKPLGARISEFRQDACVVRLNIGPSPRWHGCRLPTSIGFSRLWSRKLVQIDSTASKSMWPAARDARTYHHCIGLDGISEGGSPWVKNYGLQFPDIVTISTKSLPERLRDVWSLGVEGASINWTEAS